MPQQPQDSENPPYRTGDDPLTGVVCYLVTMPATMWFQAAWMDSQLGMTSENKWQQDGTVTIDEAVESSSTMYVRITTMIGMIFLWASGTTPPFPALRCDSTEYDRVDYPQLYELLTEFHTGPDTFKTPDMRQRVPVGAGSGYDIGDTGGEAAVTLDVSTMPAHYHTVPGTITLVAVSPGELPVHTPSPFVDNTSTEGLGGEHNNMQPYLALEYWIMSS